MQRSCFLTAIFFTLVLASSHDHFAPAQENDTKWQNTDLSVKYIGTEQCVECHKEQHSSYRKTTHSVATLVTDAAGAGAPASYTHPVLQFRYEVEQQGDQVVHREKVTSSDGETLAVTEKPIAFSVGSGQHAKSYLFREGEFFGQSPLTWYEETNSYRMSPGFETFHNPSFHRKIDAQCVFCHVGSIDRKQSNPYKFEIVETTIGCERCHGPGQLHAERHRQNPGAGDDDTTIVNPDRLSRQLAEAICQQCHLQGVSWTTTTGKNIWDYRPGQRLTDVRVDFQFATGGGMRIVGHVEQMHASECYKQTETLTCTTCHDPHNPIPTAERNAYYRDVCLDCHKDESCGTSHAQRMRLADNNCSQCHMPKAATNVTHAAFHHHRIGIHTEEDDPSLNLRAELIPVLDVSTLSRREQIRCLSIAKILTLRSDPTNPDYNHFGQQAVESLIQLKNGGPVDAMSDTQLAVLAIAQNQRSIAQNLAEEAIRKDPRPTLPHIEATGLLAKMAFQDGNKQRAVELYRKMARLHRDANDLYLLGLCESNVGNVNAAVTALKKSIALDPMQIGPHAALQAIYNANNQGDAAAEHAESQRQIAEYMQTLQRRGGQ